MILRATGTASSGSTENISLGRNNTPMDSNGPLLTRMGNAGVNGRGSAGGPASGGAAPFNAKRSGFRPGSVVAGEQDIILSPQIRSFNMGCQLPPVSATFPGPGTGPAPGPPGLLGDAASSEGNTASAGRRIGSGRIMNREREERMSGGWNSDYKTGRDGSGPGGVGGNDNYGDLDRDNDYHRGGRGGAGGPAMNKPNSRFFRMNDRRDGPNDQDGGGGGGGHRGGYNSYRNSNSYGDNGERGGGRSGGGGYHRNHRYEQEEPEWFTGGPCSQLDTIELHGFDGPAEEKGGDAAATGDTRKNKRTNDTAKEKSKEEAEQANERRKRGNEGAGSKNHEDEALESRKGEENKRKGSKDSFASFGQEEESALRKMIPSGSSPIKKPGAGGQMDMRHFEDFLRLEDLLNVSIGKCLPRNGDSPFYVRCLTILGISTERRL